MVNGSDHRLQARCRSVISVPPFPGFGHQSNSPTSVLLVICFVIVGCSSTGIVITACYLFVRPRKQLFL